MTSPDGDIDGKPCVTIRCQDNSSVGVTFCDRFSFDQDSVHYAIEAWAPGLTARVNEVVAWIWDNDLTTFLEELAAGYRGWDGERTWHTMERDLAISAVFRSGGYIGLTWTIRPWRSAAGDWSTSVTTWLEAGEQMSSLASDVRHFLEGSAPSYLQVNDVWIRLLKRNTASTTTTRKASSVTWSALGT